MKRISFVGFIALVVLHQDVWLWSVETRVLGLPAGLFYHVSLCVCASLVFYGLGASLVDEDEA